jgi:hypothetical protein
MYTVSNISLVSATLNSEQSKSPFVFFGGMSCIQVCAQIPAVLIEVSCGIFQSIQADVHVAHIDGLRLCL